MRNEFLIGRTNILKKNAYIAVISTSVRGEISFNEQVSPVAEILVKQNQQLTLNREICKKERISQSFFHRNDR